MSLYPLYLIARDVGGDYVEGSYSKSLNISPHRNEVPYGDIQAIKRLMFFPVGCGIEQPLKSVLVKKKYLDNLCEEGAYG